jgi:aryl-alcohol dehydrogenase-like predicted oxidoreductase
MLCLGMAIVPWSVLAGGRLRSDADEKKREESGEGGRALGPDWKRNDNERKMSAALEKVGQEVGCASVSAGRIYQFYQCFDLTSPVVAIAYVMHKSPYVFPLIGGRKVEHLQENIKALSLKLSPEQIKYLESVLPFTAGFPHDFIVCDFCLVLVIDSFSSLLGEWN